MAFTGKSRGYVFCDKSDVFPTIKVVFHNRVKSFIQNYRSLKMQCPNTLS